MIFVGEEALNLRERHLENSWNIRDKIMETAIAEYIIQVNKF